MGDETSEFASRFSIAVGVLDRFAGEGDTGRGEERRASLRDALEAVEAVYATETGAVREWPEKRRRVLAQLARLRAVLGASGVVGEEARREARALVRAIEPTAPGVGADPARR